MKTIKSAVSLYLIIALLLTTACKRDRRPPNDITQTVIDNALSNDLFDDLSRQTMLYENGITGNCPQVTISSPDTADFPKGIIINYEQACTGPFNRIRSGRLLINQSAPFTEKGMTREILIENYRVDDIEISGYRSVVCTGTSTQGYPIYEVQDSLGMLILPDEKTIEYTAQTTREWTGGNSTRTEYSDDEWKIHGSGS